MDSSSLRLLDLSENGIGTVAVRCLLGALTHNDRLEKLHLGKNKPANWTLLRSEFPAHFEEKKSKSAARVLY
jgi:hypothetical protein